MVNQKIQVVHKYLVHKSLYVFELRELAQLAPVIDLSSIQTELASLRADIDSCFSTPIKELDSSPSALVEHSMLDVLLNGDAKEQPEPTLAQGNRHWSSCTTEATEDERNKKRERRQEKQAKKDSIVDKQLWQ